MTPPNAAVEPITSDLVIIDSSETQEASESSKAAATEKATETPKEAATENIAKKPEDPAESVYFSDNDGREPRRFNRPLRAISRERSFSPPPRPRGFSTQIYDIPSLINTASLNDFINQPDTCANTATNSMIYIANNPFHATELDKISWIFKIGIQDTWVRKPASFLTSNGYQFDLPPRNSRPRAVEYNCYDDRYYDDFDGHMNRRNTPIARLGTSLRLFKDDSEKYGTKKVKFMIAVQGKGNAAWLKLVISHSRQAAAVDIFHEILNGHSIQFVGAVLQDVVIPVQARNKQPAIKFQRVGSLKEAEEVGKGVIGVIC